MSPPTTMKEVQRGELAKKEARLQVQLEVANNKVHCEDLENIQQSIQDSRTSATDENTERLRALPHGHCIITSFTRSTIKDLGRDSVCTPPDLTLMEKKLKM